MASVMFYSLPYHLMGFSDDEWDGIPRGQRGVIKSYVLNGYNEMQTILYDELENSPRRVSDIVEMHKIDERPKIQVNPEDICIAQI